MTSGFIGSPQGNVIVPVVNLVKQSKWVDFSSTGGFTGTGTNSTGITAVNRAMLQAGADSSGNWFLNYIIKFTANSTGVRTQYTLDLNAQVTAKSTEQCAGVCYLGNADSIGVVRAPANDHILVVYHASADNSPYYLNGTIELASEPTWYAANAEGAANVAVYIPSASASSAGLVDTLAQTFEGVKTLNQNPILVSGKGLNYAANTAGTGTGYTPGSRVLVDYEEGTLATTWTCGITTSASKNIKFVRLSSLVTVNIEALELVMGVDTGGYMAATQAIPTKFRPSTNSYFPCTLMESGGVALDGIGRVYWLAGGTIRIYRTPAESATFTGNAGWFGAICFSYLIG